MVFEQPYYLIINIMLYIKVFDFVYKPGTNVR